MTDANINFSQNSMSQVQPLVIDTSFTLAWIYADEKPNAAAMQVLEEIESYELYVPPIWMFEVSNSLLSSERQKRSTRLQTEHWIELLEDLAVKVDFEMTLAPFGEIISYARTTKLTTYDSTFLYLAVRNNASIATLDKNLIKAAKEAGVEVIS